MNKGRTLFAFLSFIFTIAIFAVTSADAQLYSGRATGINSILTVGGNPTNTTVADTCPLSITGGSHIATTPVGLIPGLVRTGPITSTTSGAGKTSQASSTVLDLNLTAGGYTIRAASVNSSAQCDCCTPSAPACTGKTTITGLTITSPSGVTTTPTANGSANQTIQLGTAGSIIINEQNSSLGEINVNALHINITGANGTNTNVIVAGVHADISCATTVPTAAYVNVSGRVLDTTGRGIGRATITLNSGGTIVTTTSNSLGRYSFANVLAGETYILEATHTFYTFEPVVLNVLDEVTDGDIRAAPQGAQLNQSSLKR